MLLGKRGYRALPWLLLLSACARVGFGPISSDGRADATRDRVPLGDHGPALAESATHDTPTASDSASDRSARDAATDRGTPDAPLKQCYCDSDGDSWISDTAVPKATSSCAAAGCQDLPGTDCCDQDPLASPGATTFRDKANLCGSWDWNCSGTPEKDKHCFVCAGAGSWGTGTCPGTTGACSGSSCQPTGCGQPITRIVAFEYDPPCLNQTKIYTNNQTLLSTAGFAGCGIEIGVCAGAGCTFPNVCLCR